jgi:hypothetical protein
LDVGVAVAAGVEPDRGAELAGLGPLVVAGVIDGADVNDDPKADGGHTIKGHHGAHS